MYLLGMEAAAQLAQHARLLVRAFLLTPDAQCLHLVFAIDDGLPQTIRIAVQRIKAEFRFFELRIIILVASEEIRPVRTKPMLTDGNAVKIKKLMPHLLARLEPFPDFPGFAGTDPVPKYGDPPNAKILHDKKYSARVP